MTQRDQQQDDPVQRVRPDGASSVVLVCEHASARIPAGFDGLGLDPRHRDSHAVWDPGAMAVARRISARLDAALVAGGVSRLIYDCNRPPQAADAMPAQSEQIAVPGNAGLSAAQRADRVTRFYGPFRAALAAQIARTKAPVIVTIHSFTPVYEGVPRAVEIGVLHDTDARLADALLESVPPQMGDVQRNAPYGPQDGVTHTLKEHAIRAGHLNVMLEIRNDLIACADTQAAMGDRIADWLVAAFARTGAEGCVRCLA